MGKILSQTHPVSTLFFFFDIEAKFLDCVKSLANYKTSGKMRLKTIIRHCYESFYVPSFYVNVSLS